MLGPLERVNLNFNVEKWYKILENNPGKPFFILLSIHPSG
jgi:hypothetical protein